MNVETIPCAFKERVEARVVDELLTISEKCWRSDWKNTKGREVLRESREDLSSLAYKMLVIEDDNTSCSSLKTPFAAWQVCVLAKQHEGGYQMDPQSLDARSMSRKNPQFFTPTRCCYNNFTPKEDKNEENGCVERDNVKETRAKSSLYVDQPTTNNIQDGGRLKRNTSSPHTGLKFYHSKHAEFYINSYRKQITDYNIKKHIEWRIRENSMNTVKKPPKKAHEVKSKTIPKPSFTFYSFRIPKKKNTCDTGVLKVGPCPRNIPEQNDSKKARFGKIKTNLITAPTLEKKDQRKETKSLTNLEYRSTPQTRTESTVTISGQDNEGNSNDTTKAESSERKLKKVHLKVHECSTESPRIVAKGRAANKSKYERKVTRKPTLGEKEFLRITTPKPLIHGQQLSKTPSDFGESPGFSPEKSVEVSPMRSPVPSVSGTSLRSQVIAEILMKREPQVVFPKNSNFQACITPSNYSTSSVESHIRQRRGCTPDGIVPDLDEELERNHNEKRMQRIPSKPSIPRIGPFISG
ncbi:hypothetical protein ACROYT_G017025 [Oculina patagonica]